jgi:hypothetical protein
MRISSNEENPSGSRKSAWLGRIAARMAVIMSVVDPTTQSA